MEVSIVASGTACAPEDREILHQGGDNASVKTFPFSKIRFPPVDRRLDVPGAQTTGENNDVILHEARARAFARWVARPNLLGSIESVNILSFINL